MACISSPFPASVYVAAPPSSDTRSPSRLVFAFPLAALYVVLHTVVPSPTQPSHLAATDEAFNQCTYVLHPTKPMYAHTLYAHHTSYKNHMQGTYMHQDQGLWYPATVDLCKIPGLVRRVSLHYL
ncbi:hypothetical protein ACRALDRAFT_2034305 [Sodiomyces alcalophilus JCM 7366]|uniref:uncharacterized protein n=1 Tax=Sodiomyces alcalophilus JCM 7366 TaxID=591952 RepID=UPI0039B52CD1